MKRSLWAISAAFVLAITLVAPVSAAGRLTLSACATADDALQITLRWSGIAATSYGFAVYDAAGGQIYGGGAAPAKSIHRFVWTVVADLEPSSATSVVGGLFDSRAGAPVELTVTAPWSACPASRR